MSKIIHTNAFDWATSVVETVNGSRATTVINDSTQLQVQYANGFDPVLAPGYSYDIVTDDQLFAVGMTGSANASSTLTYQSGGSNIFQLTSTFAKAGGGDFQVGAHGNLMRSFGVQFTSNYRDDITHIVGPHLNTTHTAVTNLAAQGDLHTGTFWNYTNDGSEFDNANGQYIDLVRIDTWVGDSRLYDASTKLEFFLPTEGSTSIGLLKRETDWYPDKTREEFTFASDGTTVLLHQFFDSAGNLVEYHAANSQNHTLDAVYDTALDQRTLTSDGHTVTGFGDIQDLANQPLWLIGHDGASVVANDGAGFSVHLIGGDGASLIGDDGASLIGDNGAGLIGHDGAGLTVLANEIASVVANDGAGVVSNDGAGFAARLIGDNGSGLLDIASSAVGALGSPLLIVKGGAELVSQMDRAMLAMQNPGIVAGGGGNIVAGGGGNIVAGGGLNFVPTLNFFDIGGANIVAGGGGNIVAGGGGNFRAFTSVGEDIPGLVGLYQFEDQDNLGLNTSGRGGFELETHGGATHTDSGKFGGGLALDGTGFLATFDGDAPLGFPIGDQAYTVSAWFNANTPGADSHGGRYGIVGWGEYGLSRQSDSVRLANGGTSGDPETGLVNAWGSNDLFGGTNPYDGQFHNVTVTYNGVDRTLYLDNTAIATDQPGVAANVKFTNFAVGRTSPLNDEFFHGTLDNVAVFSRALTAAEVANVVQGNFKEPTGPSVPEPSDIRQFRTLLTEDNNLPAETSAAPFAILSDGNMVVAGNPDAGSDEPLLRLLSPDGRILDTLAGTPDSHIYIREIVAGEDGHFFTVGRAGMANGTPVVLTEYDSTLAPVVSDVPVLTAVADPNVGVDQQFFGDAFAIDGGGVGVATHDMFNSGGGMFGLPGSPGTDSILSDVRTRLFVKSDFGQGPELFSPFDFVIPNPYVFFSDYFDKENNNTALQNYDAFQNWTVQGAVDLIGQGSNNEDYFPGHGIYVDLGGSNGQFGGLTSKAVYQPGDYVLRFTIGGTGRGPSDGVTVKMGNDYQENFNLGSNEIQTRTIFTHLNTAGQLSFTDMGLSGNPNVGISLIDVMVTRDELGAGNQRGASGVQLDNGTVALAFSDTHYFDNNGATDSSSSISVSVVDIGGNLIGGSKDFVTDTGVAVQQHPSIAQIGPNEFAVAYYVEDNGGHRGIRVQNFDALGFKLGVPRQLDGFFDGAEPIVRATHDGGFIVGAVRNDSAGDVGIDLFKFDLQGTLTAQGTLANPFDGLPHLDDIQVDADGLVLVNLDGAKGAVRQSTIVSAIVGDPGDVFAQATQSTETLSAANAPANVTSYLLGAPDLAAAQTAGGNGTAASLAALNQAQPGNTFIGGPGTTFAYAYANENTFQGGTGVNNFTGGPDDDLLFAGQGVNHFDGQGGVNTVSWVNLSFGTTLFNDPLGVDDVVSNNGDTIKNIQVWQLTNEADRFVGSTTASDGPAFGLSVSGLSGADTITGTNHDDILIGGANGDAQDGDDVLNGRGGADELHGGPGNDHLDGGLGIDSAVVAGNRAAYTFARDGNVVTVDGPDGVDALTRVDRLKFDDITLSINRTANDFNSDGKSDVLFSNLGAVYASNYEWQINDRSLLAQNAIDLYDPTFNVQVVGDFNGDTYNDLIFRNPDTGGVWEWQLNGFGIIAQGAVDVADPGFRLLAAADFNGDGKDDLLYRNDAGFVYMWQMNGLSDTPLPVGALDPVWQVQGAADFNGDGRDDILLHYDNTANALDPANGAFVVWQMNGNVIENTLGIERPDPTWKVLGVGDFNGDDVEELAIRNVSNSGDNGAVWVYLLNGNITTHGDGSKTIDMLAQGAAGIADSATWRLQQIGDLDGDGEDDVLFRNDAGYFYSWNMNGATIRSEGLLQGGALWADPSFSVVTQHWETA